MDIKQLTKDHLSKINVLQLATSTDDEPWICTVHFYTDEDLNLYWVSRTDRKHSQQIASNPRASVTAVVHENTKDEDYVISVTMSGRVELIKSAPQNLRDAYQAKLDKPDNFLPNPDDPNDMQAFYRLTPDKLIVFDTKNIQGNPRQELKL